MQTIYRVFVNEMEANIGLPVSHTAENVFCGFLLYYCTIKIDSLGADIAIEQMKFILP